MVCLLLLALALSLAGDALASTSLGKAHVDKSLGFSIRTPKDWNFVGSPEEERYIVAKFSSDKLLEVKKVKDWTDWGSHRPIMQIIAFTPENKELVEETETRKEGDTTITMYFQRNPYRDFKELTKRTCREGFYFGEEKEDEVNGVPCTYLDVILEQARPPKRWEACIYHMGDVDIAVFFEIMEEYHSKYQSLFKGAFRSFKRVEREAVEADPEGSNAGEPMTLDEFIESKTSDLPEGWIHKVSKRHLVISHADKKYTDKVADFADGMRNAIEKDFKKMKYLPKIKGDENEATLPIIRICKDAGEYNAYHRTTEGFSYFNEDTQEVVVFNDSKGWGEDRVYFYTGNGIFWQYQTDLLSLKWISPDSWFTYGLSYYYGCFKGKGSSVKFQLDDWERDMLREAVRKGECSPLKSLIDPDNRTGLSWGNYLKMGSFMCFLKSKDGNRKPWKGTLERYMQSLIAASEDLDGKWKKKLDEVKGGAGDDEGGEDDGEGLGEEISNERKEAVKAAKRKIYQDTFPGWTDVDWQRLEKAWENWAI